MNQIGVGGDRHGDVPEKALATTFTYVWNGKEYMPEPHKNETISWFAIFMVGILVAFVPAIAWGCIITWLAWEIGDDLTAVFVGSLAFLITLYSGGWIALVIQMLPHDLVKDRR